jgi:LysM repeat protein/ABC-type branched-subunit amino acid transport system substrate-binding protein
MRVVFQLILISFLLVFAQEIQAQVTIVKSTEAVQDASGQNFLLHHVAKGENLYRISLAYGVSSDILIKTNPEAAQGLKVGQTLKIPIPQSEMPQTKVTKIAPDGFSYHQVLKGETMFAVLKKYQLTLGDLQRYNPDLTDQLKLNQWILIPSQQKIQQDNLLNKWGELEEYTLRNKDNYYRLHKKFSLSQEDLEEINPELKSSGLKKGLVIKVPKLNSFEGVADTLVTTGPTVKEEKLAEEIIVKNEKPNQRLKCNPQVSNRTYKIGIMVPLFTELNSQIQIENSYLIKRSEEYKSFKFIEFYQGAKLALDSLKQLGLKAEIYVWDTKFDKQTVDSIIKIPIFKELDLVIGPFHSSNSSQVLAAAAKYNIHCVDLFDDLDAASFGAKTFFVKTSEIRNYYALGKYIQDSLPNYRISIIHNGSDAEIQRLKNLKKALYASNLRIDTSRVYIYNYKNAGFTNLMNSLDAKKINVVFNLVENEATISNFLRQLNLKKKEFSIMVMGIEKSWSKFTTLELNYLNDLHYTFSTDFNVDYEDSLLVKSFDDHFYKTYKKTPPKMGYLGYDVTWFFGHALLYFGQDFDKCINEVQAKTMHTAFDFKPISAGVFQNYYTNVVQYDNYQKLLKSYKPSHAR